MTGQPSTGINFLLQESMSQQLTDRLHRVCGQPVRSPGQSSLPSHQCGLEVRGRSRSGRGRLAQRFGPDGR